MTRKSHKEYRASSRWSSFSGLGLRGRLMIALIPSVVCILLAAGMGNYRVSECYINIALERFVRLQNLAVAHAVESFLEQARSDLIFVAQRQQTEESMGHFLRDKVVANGIRYVEFSYLDPSGDGHIVLLRKKDGIVRLKEQEVMRICPNPLLLFGEHADLAFGEVWVSPVTEVEYPLPSLGAKNTMIREQTIRLVTPYRMNGQNQSGFLMLTVSAANLRDVLTLYNSEASPLWAFPRSGELRYDYMVDPDGWMLFQSSVGEEDGEDLTTFLARSGYEGTLGRPGLRGAFRPNASHDHYWKMMQSLQSGKNGLMRMQDAGADTDVHDFFFAYAPIWYNAGPHTGKILYGGTVRVDRSILPIVAGYKYLDVMLVVTVVAIFLIASLIYWLGRKLTSPIRILSEELNSLCELEELKEIYIPYGGRDIEALKNSVNDMVRRISRQMEVIREKDEVILNVNQREPANLAEEQRLLDEAPLSILPDIIGIGTRMTELKNDVLKAARVDVDVLVTGETGTGKQLVAEAIHAHSKRKGGPFVCINCGALDENLLLDALFGHVKGAFTEACSDRNGAFLEAGTGTLFLDEIQSASPKVQQSLLRALAIRKIKPLGSDSELPIDVRIIAASNVDLTELIGEGLFREDLYYRLKVVSINAPSLREHPENISLLALHYLHQAEQLTGRSGLELSKGALHKLATYSWPGNIRELINSITRAVVMAETEVIQVEEIRLEGEKTTVEAAGGPYAAESGTKKDVEESVHKGVVEKDLAETVLNPRQIRAWPVIQNRGDTSRSEYQEIVGENLSPRTANYDLNDFVKKGFLVRVGRGPATRYAVAGH